jgi:hypothetical protein
MKRLLCFAGEIAVDGNQIARARSLAGDDDLIVAQTAFECQLGGLQSGEHHAIVDNFFGFFAEIFVRVLLHFVHDELLIQRAAIHADAHGLAIVARNFADRRKLLVAALARANVAGIDAVLVQRFRALRIFRKENVAVVMKIADDGRVAARIEQALLNFGHGGSSLRHIYRPADNLRAGFRKLDSLLEC